MEQNKIDSINDCNKLGKTDRMKQLCDLCFRYDEYLIKIAKELNERDPDFDNKLYDTYGLLPYNQEEFAEKFERSVISEVNIDLLIGFYNGLFNDPTYQWQAPGKRISGKLIRKYVSHNIDRLAASYDSTSNLENYSTETLRSHVPSELPCLGKLVDILKPKVCRGKKNYPYEVELMIVANYAPYLKGESESYKELLELAYRESAIARDILALEERKHSFTRELMQHLATMHMMFSTFYRVVQPPQAIVTSHRICPIGSNEYFRQYLENQVLPAGASAFFRGTALEDNTLLLARTKLEVDDRALNLIVDLS